MKPLDSFIKTIIYSALLFVGLILLPARAETLVDDGFDDGTRTAGTDPLAVSWYSMVGPGTDLAIVSDNGSGGIGSGNALEVTPTVASEGFVGNISLPTTLMDGQSMTLTFQWRYTGSTNTNQANLFRFGLFDSRGTPVAAPSGIGDNDPYNRVDDVGYYGATNPGLASTSGTSLYEFGTATHDGKMTYIATLTGSTALSSMTKGASINAGTTAHTATLVITRSGTTLSFTAAVDGQTTAIGTDTNPLTYTFDEIAIANAGSIPSPFIVDNIELSYTGGGGDAVLINDGFGNGTRYAGSDPLAVSWYSKGGAGTILSVVDDSTGIGSGYALKFAATEWYEGEVANLPSTVTLADGDSISVTYNWRYTATYLENTTNSLGMGFYNSNGTRTSTDNDAVSRTDDVGYYGATNAGLASTSGTNIARNINGGEICQGVRCVFGGTPGASIAAGTTTHSTVFTITRSGSTLNLSESVDGNTPATYTDSSPLTYSFDELATDDQTAYGPSPVLIDNVEVQYSVPGGSTIFPGLGAFIGDGTYGGNWNTLYSVFLTDMSEPVAYFNPTFADGNQLDGPNGMLHIAGASEAAQHSNAVAKNLTPIVSLPLANHSSLGNGTKEIADFANIVAGTYDTEYTTIFRDYIGTGKWSTIYVRLGWEQNDSGSSYPWYVSNATGAADYVAAWKHVANLAHTWAAANGGTIKTVWCPATCNYSTSLTDTYPDDSGSSGYVNGGSGDQYVDDIAIDIYSAAFPSSDGNFKYEDWGTGLETTNLTAWAAGPGSAVDRAHWLDYPGGTLWTPTLVGGGSLTWIISQAKTHLKPIAIPETGNNGYGDVGLADDPTTGLWEADRLSGAIATGLTVDLVSIWDNPSGAQQITDGTHPNEVASWQQFVKIMAAVTP